MYKPTMPVVKSWIPLTNRIMQTRLAQPCTGSPKTSLRTMIKTMKANESRIPIMPATAEKASGFVENPMIPSIEYKKSFQNDHLVLPATRSTFSYSNHFVLKPTQGKIPFVKRFFSHKERTAFLYCSVISRK